MEGAVMLSADVFTLWSARRMADVTIDSLSLLRLLKPVPDLLVLGCGRRMQRLPPDLAWQLHHMGVRVDALDTTNAVSTFNVLNQEGRKVVGALLPLGADD
ncbi:NADH dehydrogenase [ubiquinone] 1 alpha subcomplex assembly factor 3-like [Micractinium conductrix]|uniref:NADH dehydrogenase [ubiquinone] 1 alpha subcomplex assembly factor 3-like n=1 Tax=Micractinium conductrix TaxID=554055 RepID=A0A2P6VLD2_9CHLO|nr:NADH dehydrogenase [ubiquinone] 1 alpha subcomplex assembly factor 3-like [Micractinium conductrix]|eukprot:PSC74894.1 NADH dehydrogenase [ubiquinone] 1 alpha subcomplex assembly factor 3-like [Micractinium conductrix]